MNDVPKAALDGAPPEPSRLITSYLAVSDEPLLLADRRGRVVLLNGAARRLLGGAPTEAGPLPGMRMLLRHVRSSGRATWNALLSALRKQTPVMLRVSLQGRDVELRVRPVGDGWAVRAGRGTDSTSTTGERLGAAFDPLTGLPNRIRLHEQLSEAAVRLSRLDEGCAVFMIDLDRFKQVNDSLGHAVGDALLRTVADRLRSTVRATDTVARVGGDEFVILQGGTRTAEQAQLLAVRLVDLVGRAYIVEGHLISIGASVGVALAPEHGTEPEKLLRNADLALYRAKRDGRGTFRFFEPAMDARVQARRLLELELRKALAMKEFELHYQPQLNLETDRLAGFEALLRWRNPRRGLVPPNDFVPLAEEIGLIVPIGEWVIRTACREAARWPETVSVAVNLSPAQFRSKRLVETVSAALGAANLAPQRLELEITEGVLMNESTSTLDTLHRLRDLGLRISMDDFGTGYSSLSYLRSFPFDRIKIDRSFVAELTKNADSHAIIRAIAGLGTSLGMTTVAEGVETIEQMQRIRAEGCTDVQGFLISKPIPPDEIAQLLCNHRQAA